MGVKKNETTGWVIVHPDGRVETAYFDVKRWKGKSKGWPGTASYRAPQRISRESWRRQFRPNCQIVRATLSWERAS